LGVLAAALTVAAVACGGGGDAASGAASPAAERTPVPADPVVAGLRNAKLPLALAKGTRIGSPDAKVVLAEWEDFQCPFCLRYTATQETFLLSEYVATGKVAIEFHHFPILGPESLAAAVAAQCAAQQELFWPYHEKLFLVQAEAGQHLKEQLNQGRFSIDNLKKYAADVKADQAKFDACLDAGATVAAVVEDTRAARSLGLAGTPGFTINGQPLGSGAPATNDAWRKVLDEALKK
jgi:protein-disulfide isomerase